MENYTVLLSREAVVPVSRLASAFGTLLDRPVIEITKCLRLSPWILLDDVPATSLDAVFAVLSKEHIVAKAVPDVHMPTLPAPLRLRHADAMEAGLFLQKAQPPAPPILPWSDLRLVSAGKVTQPPDDPLLVDLIYGGETPLRMRIDGGEFRYDYLGDRMKPQSRENLRLLLGDIAERAPDAHFTDRTQHLMAGEPPAAWRFRAVEGFEAYTRWVLQAIEEAALDEAEAEA